jgi:hypothetical protein
VKAPRTVDDLVSELGAVRVAAHFIHADVVARAAIETAIWQATTAVSVTLRHPDSPREVSTAAAAIKRAAALVAALDSEFARSRRLASTAAGLSLRIQARRAAKPDRWRS